MTRLENGLNIGDRASGLGLNIKGTLEWCHHKRRLDIRQPDIRQ